MGCKRGSTDSHGILVAGILTLENCGAERGLAKEARGHREDGIRTGDIVGTRASREVDYRVRALSEQL